MVGVLSYVGALCVAMLVAGFCAWLVFMVAAARGLAAAAASVPWALAVFGLVAALVFWGLV